MQTKQPGFPNSLRLFPKDTVSRWLLSRANVHRRQQINITLTLDQLQPIHPEEIKLAAQNRDKEISAAEKYEKIQSRKLDKLKDGDTVLIKHHKMGRWVTEAEVLSKRPDGLSYIIKDENGHQLIRGRNKRPPRQH